MLHLNVNLAGLLTNVRSQTKSTTGNTHKQRMQFCSILEIILTVYKVLADCNYILSLVTMRPNEDVVQVINSLKATLLEYRQKSNLLLCRENSQFE